MKLQALKMNAETHFPVLLVSGTRPEVIKLAPLFHALRASGWAQPAWVHTGQHDDMAWQMLRCFDVEPDCVLKRHGSSLLDFSLGCRSQLATILEQQQWSALIVQGDTESAFAGALSGFYGQVPVAHVEAGLRTHNLVRPFPEEGLRQMISRIASIHLAPTPRAAAALQAEGLEPELIAITGNTVVDAQRWVRAKYGIRRRVRGFGHLLITMHRRENWGPDIDNVCSAVAEVARMFPELPILFPVHLNPMVREPVHRHLQGLANIQLTAPLDYLQMQQALADAWVVLSDSGGLQEEAPTYGVPMLVLRRETERAEVLQLGCARLVGTDRRSIVDQLRRLKTDAAYYRSMRAERNPFGDGRASERIVHRLHALLKDGSMGVGTERVREPA